MAETAEILSTNRMTRAQLKAAIAAGTLAPWTRYFVTDENLLVLSMEGGATIEFSGKVVAAPAPVPAPPPPAPPAPAPAPAHPHPAGTKLADENRGFTLTAPTLVRYGANATWAQKALPAGVHACDNATFGDPLPNVVKRCESLGAVPAGTVVAPPAPAPAPAPSPAPAPPAVPSAFPRFFPAGAFKLAPGGDLQAAIRDNAVVMLGDGAYPDAEVTSGKTVVGIPGLSKIRNLTVRPGSDNWEVKGLSLDYQGGAKGLVFPASTVETKDGRTSHTRGGISGAGATVSDVTFWSAFWGPFDFRDANTKRLKILRPHTHNHAWGGSSTLHAIHLSGQGLENTVVAQNPLSSQTGSVFLKGQKSFLLVGNDDERGEKGLASLDVDDGCSDVLIIGHSGFIHNGSDSVHVRGRVDNLVIEHSTQSVDGGGRMWVEEPGSVLTNKFCVKAPLFAGSMGVGNRSTRPAIKVPPLGPVPIIPRLQAVSAAGLPDDTATLQAGLDRGGVLELSRKARISRSLKIKRGTTKIIGAGMDVSAIVADGDFPIFELELSGGTTIGFSLFDFAMHGGRFGLQLAQSGIQLNDFEWSSVAFVGQSVAGINVETPLYAIDNGGADHLLFQRCGTGIKHVGNFNFSDPNLCYIDKTHFYQCTFYDCQPFFIKPARGNHLISFIECAAEGDSPVFLDTGNHIPTLYNCRLSHPVTSTSPTLIVYP